MSVTLVTGATGFVGRHVARRLVASGAFVIALARTRDGASARERLAGAPGGACAGRVGLVEGDLSLLALGLGRADLGRLRERVDTVVHCAGDPTFFPDDPGTYRAGHVEGPVALLRALAGGALHRWVQVSTAFVCGRRSGTIREDEGDVGQDFHNPYERVKLEAETALRAAARAAGLELVVLRPSIVVGAAPATTGGTPAALLFAFIRLLAMLARLPGGRDLPLRVPARPGARFNIVPVEHVADAVAALARLPAAAGLTAHLVVDPPPTQAAMLDMIAARLGVRGARVVEGRLSNPSPIERQVLGLTGRYREYLEQDVVFGDATARRLLAWCGLAPAALDEDAVGRLVDAALGPAVDRERSGGGVTTRFVRTTSR